MSVSVQVFMESQCPACIDFTASQLTAVMTAIPDITTLTVYPFGNAEESTLEDGTYAYSCQHGTNECTANMWEACATRHYPDQTTWFPFFQCVEASDVGLNRDAPFDTSLIQGCAASASLDWDVLSACAGSDPASGSQSDGNLIMHEIALATEASNKTFCPWVVIDGVALTEDAIDTGVDLVQLVCDAYDAGPKPAACKPAAAASRVPFRACPDTTANDGFVITDVTVSKASDGALVKVSGRADGRTIEDTYRPVDPDDLDGDWVGIIPQLFLTSTHSGGVIPRSTYNAQLCGHDGNAGVSSEGLECPFTGNSFEIEFDIAMASGVRLINELSIGGNKKGKEDEGEDYACIQFDVRGPLALI
jgi:interferon gamma-inducible protein 30